MTGTPTDQTHPRQQLLPLTSLRFFAAMMIVLHHAHGKFGLGNPTFPGYAMDQGVSFFFVLSGFILTYVYPSLDTWSERKRFITLRIARIWPAHVCALVLLILLFLPKSIQFPDSKHYGILAMNIGMLHSWIPFKDFFFSFNSPSWSISTELFFYLSFIFLIPAWSKTWQWKLCLSGLVAISMIYLCNVLKLPGFTMQSTGLTADALINIHPVTRLFEFVLGMAIAMTWQRFGQFNWPAWKISLVEIMVVALVMAGVKFTFDLSVSSKVESLIGRSGQIWILHSGSCFLFAGLIYFVASGKGVVSKFLSLKVLVLLGEASYSVYLLHQIILRYYDAHSDRFSSLPNTILFTGYLACVILTSLLLWKFVERPSRKWIANRL